MIDQCFWALLAYAGSLEQPPLIDAVLIYVFTLS